MDRNHYYHPIESGHKLSRMSNSELHRLLTDYRFTYATFSRITGRASGRVKAIQSLLHKRGVGVSGTTIPEAQPPAPIVGGVTDHAIVRYLERVKGIDIKATEDEILERVRNGESYFGGGVIVDAEGVGYIMREDGLVKSVIPHEWISEADGIAAQESHRIKRPKTRRHHQQAAANNAETQSG